MRETKRFKGTALQKLLRMGFLLLCSHVGVKEYHHIDADNHDGGVFCCHLPFFQIRVQHHRAFEESFETSKPCAIAVAWYPKYFKCENVLTYYVKRCAAFVRKRAEKRFCFVYFLHNKLATWLTDYHHEEDALADWFFCCCFEFSLLLAFFLRCLSFFWFVRWGS